ncbi:MAG: hypothetical protein IJX28_00625 [Clostridia bacterium]|nr:hypothetical protein [Clostridia bacterium]
MKSFCFTVDDNIRCFKELTHGTYGSIFEHPYFNMYKRLHQKYGVKVQLNLFYEVEGFDLSHMTDRYKDEWQDNSDWLKLSFHARIENVKPYEHAGYDEVSGDCQNVHREIVRFASPLALGRTTTLHYCLATHQGLGALKDNGVEGLLGLYGTEDSPRASYQNTAQECGLIRRGEIVSQNGVSYAGIDIILNLHATEEILSRLNELKSRDFIKVMIHEQYFYPDYPRYQPNFEKKLSATFDFLTQNGFMSTFFEEHL